MTALLTKRHVLIITFTAIVLGSLIAFGGRLWLVSDLNTPSYHQPSSVSLLFHSPQLGSAHRVMKSLRTDTTISEELGGLIESKAYTVPVVGLRYIKISAPSDHIQEITSIARDHLALRYPDLTPEFSFSTTGN